MPEFIAERRLLAIKPDGDELELVLRIGRPEERSELDWGCPVELRGLHDRLGEIYAIDAFQALMLGIHFLRELLKGFVEDGGTLLWPDSRNPVSIDELFAIGVELNKR